MVEPRTPLVVLYGGRSAEHEVSCMSARYVLSAADPDRYQVSVVGIATDGRWVDATAGAAGADPAARGLPSPDAILAAGGEATDPVAALGRPGAVVWPALHGPMGEDGTVQGLLEVLGVPYVGPGVTGSAAAMDKGLAKTAFDGAGIPQARWMGVSLRALEERGEAAATGLAAEVAGTLGWPVYVKPANMGSTIGVSRAGGPDELAAAVALAAGFDDHIVVEQEVRGRELEIGVLGADPLEVSVPGEILPSHDFYDFDDKYNDGTAGLVVPASLPEGVTVRMRELAAAACRALRVEAMARVDFFYEESSDRLLVNEVNTLPGLTPISMYPKVWEAAGVAAPELVDRLVGLARERHARTSRRRTRR